MNIFINGKIVPESQAHISHKDRGLLLGDGIFETCRVNHGYIHFFEEHYKRLTTSAEFLSIPFLYSHEQLFEICNHLLEVNDLKRELAALRITLTRGISERGISVPQHPQPTLLISTTPYHPSSHFPTAMISSIKRNPFSPLTKLKTLNYLEPILARAEAEKKGYDEGIMLNINDFISESSAANIFFIKDEIITTPDLDSGILPGIMRAHTIILCNQLNIPVIEKKISPNEALAADEAFQTNSLIGIQSLSSINNKSLTINKSLVSKKIFKALKNL